jgi:hypothetical protein
MPSACDPRQRYAPTPLILLAVALAVAAPFITSVGLGRAYTYDAAVNNSLANAAPPSRAAARNCRGTPKPRWSRRALRLRYDLNLWIDHLLEDAAYFPR